MMEILFENSKFIVVWMHLLAHGDAFEIIDKSTDEEVLLVGDMSKLFQEQVAVWQEEVPQEADVQACLDRYTFLGRIPVIAH